MEIEGIVEGPITEMGCVEDYAETIHLADKFAAHLRERADAVVTERVAADPEVGGTEGTQSLGVGVLKVPDGSDGIGAFQAEQVPKRSIRFSVLPSCKHSLE